VLLGLESQRRYAVSSGTLCSVTAGVVEITGRRGGVRTARTRWTAEVTIAA